MTEIRRHLMRILPVLLMAAALIGCGEEAGETTGAMQGAPPAGASAEAVAGEMQDGVQIVDITVTPTGYRPNRIALQAGVPARLVFHRTEEGGCTDKVQIPAYGIEKTDLPVGERVAVEFTPDEAGEFTFACGMDMMEGTLVVKS